MKRFCLECGKEALSSDDMCTECGRPLESLEPESTEKIVQVQRRPIPRINKWGLVIVALLFALLVVGYKFGVSYTSAENTLKRFYDAAINQDTKTLGELVEFEGGIQLSNGELEAIAHYAKHSLNDFTKSVGLSEEESEDYLYTAKQTGKVLGLFDGYKIRVKQQYVSAPLPVAELGYTLNGEKLKITEEDGRAVIGPIAPGIYELEAAYHGAFMDFAQSEEIEVLERFGETVYADMEMEIRHVNFELAATDPTKSSLVIGDNQMAFTASGFIESVGPLLLDGSIQGKVVTDYPWGTIESDAFEVDSSSMYLETSGLNSEVEDRIAKTILAYGEEYIVAHAAADAGEMKAITNEWREELQDIYDYGRVHGVFYSGQLEEVQINFEEATLKSEADQLTFFIPTSFLTKEAFIEYGQSKLIDVLESCAVEIVYLKDEWKINGCESHWSYRKVGGTILEGSKRFVEAN